MNKKLLLQPDVECEDNFDYLDESGDEFVDNQIVNEILEANHQQMMMAIELTKIAVSKINDISDEDRVFEIFKKASEVIQETSPLASILEKS